MGLSVWCRHHGEQPAFWGMLPLIPAFLVCAHRHHLPTLHRCWLALVLPLRLMVQWWSSSVIRTSRLSLTLFLLMLSTRLATSALWSSTLSSLTHTIGLTPLLFTTLGPTQLLMLRPPRLKFAGPSCSPATLPRTSSSMLEPMGSCFTVKAFHDHVLMPSLTRIPAEQASIAGSWNGSTPAAPKPLPPCLSLMGSILSPAPLSSRPFSSSPGMNPNASPAWHRSVPSD